MRAIDHPLPNDRTTARASSPISLRPVLAAMLLGVPRVACGSEKPPPLTGNLTDSRGAHAGSFLGPDNATRDDINAASPAGSGGNGTTQD